MVFQLYDAPDPLTGTLVGTVGPRTVLVQDGLFSEELDFGVGAFNGDSRWLRITVEGTPLNPLHAITAGPYALFSLNGAGGSSSWEASGPDIFYDQGHVGIGTVPSEALHVSGGVRSDGADGGKFEAFNPADSRASVHLSWLDNVARLRVGGTGGTSSGAQNGLDIQTSGDVSLLRLEHGGNVGIGVAEPSTRLHVVGTVRSGRADEPDQYIQIHSTSSTGHWLTAWSRESNKKLLTIRNLHDGTGSPGGETQMSFLVGANGAPTEALRIRESGRVGIGTNSPGELLTVNGVIHSQSGGIRFPDGSLQSTAAGGGGSTVWASSGADIYYNAGDVGIGTSSPQEALHVVGELRLADPLIGSVYYGTYGPGLLRLRNNNVSSPITTIELTSSGPLGAQYRNPSITLRDSGGADCAVLSANDSGGGTLSLRDGNGTETVVITADYQGSGASRMITDVLQINGADLSEQFDVGGAGPVVPGMVVSIDPANPGKLAVAAAAYDRKVAGIISGAGGVRTGLVMGQEGTIAHGDHAVALTGRVWCWVDASFGPVEPGDPLTTSTSPGHAMKAADYDRARGAVIGKAMTRIESGRGMVLVLVQPQ
jgi:hypothetical protein